MPTPLQGVFIENLRRTGSFHPVSRSLPMLRWSLVEHRPGEACDAVAPAMRELPDGPPKA